MDREKAIELLRVKQEELLLRGEERFPEKGDFTTEEVVAIKAFLGPWPRALEGAGLKEVSPEYQQKLQKRIEKRIRAKRGKYQ